MLGEALGNYRLTHKISEGGMGEVYAARHVLLGRPAAVKLLRPELSSRRDIVERFFNEARATTAIRHPGIVEVLDFGFDTAGRAFLVMELLVGEPLAQRLRTGGVPLPVAVSIMRRVAHAVGAAHAQGVVHRDLKPDNLFLVNDPDVAFGIRPKVLDFGIAKLTGSEHSLTRTRTGALMGTPMYMSPEQCRGAGAVDHRADLYALGCILYELIAGRPPFIGEGLGEIIAAHMAMPPMPLSSLVPAVPPALEAVVMRCLAKEAIDRFGSAEELVAAFDAITGAPAPTPVAWSTPGRSPSLTLVSTTLGGAAAQTMKVRPAARWPWLVAAVTALGLVAGAAVLRGGGDGPGVAPAHAPAPPAAPPEVGPAHPVAPAHDVAPAHEAAPPLGAAGHDPATDRDPVTAPGHELASAPAGAPSPAAATGHDIAPAAQPSSGVTPPLPRSAHAPPPSSGATTHGEVASDARPAPVPRPRDRPRRTPRKDPAKPNGLETDL